MAGISFSRSATWVTKAAGSVWAFAAALFVVLFGKRLGWDVDQISNLTPFLMVFMIQHSQNKDGKAIQIKLNELIKVTEQARNELVGIEKMEEKEIDNIKF